MLPVTRPVHEPTYGGRHPCVSTTGFMGFYRWKAPPMVTMYGPAGLVGPVGATDHPYVGMDPSDPITWVRPYTPQPGMIGQLNFDGAQPNQTQTVAIASRVAPRFGQRKRRGR